MMAWIIFQAINIYRLIKFYRANMLITDLMNLKGEVVITAIKDDGTSTVLVNDKNLIVTAGRINLCNALAGIPSSYVYDIAFGNGGTVPGNSNVAKSVLPEETALNARIQADQGTDYSFTVQVESSPSPRVVFSTTVPKDSPKLNGKAISELGLMLNTTPNDTTFAIKRFPSISKSDSVTLILTWTIYI